MKNVDYNTIGGRIRKARKNAGFTQQQLGERLEAPSAMGVRQWELGTRNPTVASLEKVASVLGVSLAYLLGIQESTGLSLNAYQSAAARTIRKDMLDWEIESHALHGMVAEVGELHGIFQKIYQGHPAEDVHLKKELGDLLWFIAEYCTARGWELGEIAQMNIDKLKARYPEGFEADKSLHRKEGDI